MLGGPDWLESKIILLLYSDLLKFLIISNALHFWFAVVCIAFYILISVLHPFSPPAPPAHLPPTPPLICSSERVKASSGKSTKSVP